MLTGFLVSAAVATPILGRLGDQFGKERMLLISLGLFLAGCLGAAFAWNIWSLIAFRVVSGAGGALFPLSFAIIRDEFPAEKVKVGIGLLSAVWGIGGGFGIVLSGVIVDHFSWRLLFLLGSIPVALSIALVHRYVPESPIRSPVSRRRARRPPALRRPALAHGGADRGRTLGLDARARLLGLAVVAAAFFVLWALVELRSSSPMVDMRMLSHRPVLLTNIATMISGFALFSCFVLVPDFRRDVVRARLRLRRERDGGRPVPAPQLDRDALRRTAGGNDRAPHRLEVAARRRDADRERRSAALRDHARRPVPVLVASALLGLGVGAAFAAMAALIADNVDALEMGVASGMNTVVRMIGAVIGGQVGAALLTAQTIGGTSIPAESAFTITFGLSAVTALAAAAIALSIGSQPLRQRLAAGRSPQLTALIPRTAGSSSRRTHDQPPGQADFRPRADVPGTSRTAPFQDYIGGDTNDRDPEHHEDASSSGST